MRTQHSFPLYQIEDVGFLWKGWMNEVTEDGKENRRIFMNDDII